MWRQRYCSKDQLIEKAEDKGARGEFKEVRVAPSE